jgi:O-antigen ligase
MGSRPLPPSAHVLAGLVAVLAGLLANRGVWLCLKNVDNPISFCTYDYIGLEFALYALDCALAGWLLSVSGGFEGLKKRLLATPLLPAFVMLAILSVAWSVRPASSVRAIQLLLFSAFLAAFFGAFLGVRGVLRALTAFSAAIVAGSWALLVAFPRAAVMGVPHEGCWRGVFWHKNFTGVLMGLAGTLFLLDLLSAGKGRPVRALLSAAAWVLSLVYCFFSGSAAGHVVFVLMSGAAIVLLSWRALRPRLTRPRLVLAGAAMLAGAMGVAANLGSLLDILGRDPNLTGRIPLWLWLGEVALHRPWLGHGLGAVWQVPGFRDAVSDSQRWTFPIDNSHNGFVDVLLGLGVPGFLAALALALVALVRGLRYYAERGTPEAALPALLALYFLAANATISLFLDVETFHWMLLVVSLTLSAPASPGAGAPRPVPGPSNGSTGQGLVVDVDEGGGE